MIRVAEVMTRDLVRVRECDGVRETARRLLAANVHGAPVVMASGEVCGVVSLVDLVRAILDSPLDEPAVRDVMTTDVLRADPADSLQDAARAMLRKGMHRLLVFDGEGKLEGVVTPDDVLRAAVHLGTLGTRP